MTKKLKKSTTPKTLAKTKKVAKKTIKKATPKKDTKNNNQSMGLVTIPYSEIIQKDLFDNKLNGKDLHLMKSSFGPKIIQFINAPTPPKYILKRPGKGQKTFDYIPGWYARKVANYAFGFNYSFEIKNKEILGLTAVVEGRFIVTDPKTGREIFHKDDIGGHEIQFLTAGKKGDVMSAVNLANDYKSAVTDCLKRCMAQIGFFKDVYGVNEAREDDLFVEPVIVQQQAPQKAQNAVVVEAVAKPTQVVATNLKRLNTRLEQLGHKTPNQKAEFVGTKAKMPITAEKWKNLTEGEAEMIIAVLAKIMKSTK